MSHLQRKRPRRHISTRSSPSFHGYLRRYWKVWKARHLPRKSSLRCSKGHGATSAPVGRQTSSYMYANILKARHLPSKSSFEVLKASRLQRKRPRHHISTRSSPSFRRPGMETATPATQNATAPHRCLSSPSFRRHLCSI